MEKKVKLEFTEMLDLSHTLIHEQEARRFQVKPFLVDFTPRLSDVKAQPNVCPKTLEEVDRDSTLEGYYVLLHELSFNTNAGTHIEVPRHCFRERFDLSEFPLENLVGEAVILDLRGCDPQTEVSVDHLHEAEKTSGGIRPGDIVLCMFGHDRFYKTEDYKKCPYFALESIHWLVQKRIKVLGVDAPEIDAPDAIRPVNHLPLFQANIPLIENLKSLTQIGVSRVYVFILPVKVKFLDAFPVRVIALK
jgi:kynurenine formamidase